MPVPIPVFTTSRKASYPLSQYLWRLVENAQLQSRLGSIDSIAELDRFEAEAKDLIASIRPVAPVLTGAVRRASVQAGEWRPIPDQPGHREQTRRYWVAVEVHGDIHLLKRWPDGSTVDLPAVDAAVQLTSEPEHADELSELNRLRGEAEDTWIIGMHSENPPVWALYTHFDLTRDEEAEIGDGRRDLTSEVSQRIDHIKPVVAAVTEQVAHFFESELPQRLEELIHSKRKSLADRDAVIASLKFPREWSIPSLQLDVEDQPDVATTVDGSATAVENLTLPTGRPRLARASFGDIQRVIRTWADAVERHPRAYHQLVEDRISDLLAATLNATLPGAHREVYTRRGKSDILIQADTLAAGTGPEHIFICETKWADGNIVVAEAHPQLFGYLTAHDTSAVLLLLMKQKDFASAVKSRLKVLEEIDGFRGGESGPAGWPILHYSTEGRVVRLCVATIAVPQDYPSDQRAPAHDATDAEVL